LKASQVDAKSAGNTFLLLALRFASINTVDSPEFLSTLTRRTS